MENRPVITLSARNPAPGANREDFERYLKWTTDVYIPRNMTVLERLAVDFYRIARKNPEYPEILGINHYRNLKDCEIAQKTPERVTAHQDGIVWVQRGVTEMIWTPAYALTRSWRCKPAFSGNNQVTWVENAPFLHLEAHRLSRDEQEKYRQWFNDFGSIIFMPLFLKLPGLMGYDLYEYTGYRITQETRETEFSKHLSILYFENVSAYESFVESPELAGFQKALRSIFPYGLKYEWYVQYQLVRSWRK